MEDRRIDLVAEKSRDAALGADRDVLNVLGCQTAGRHHRPAHHLVERADFLDADFAAFQVFAAFDVTLNQHRLGKLVRVRPNHLCPCPSGRRDDRRIRACASDIEPAGDTSAQGLRPTFESHEFRVDIILREEAHIVGDIRRDVHHVRRSDRDSKDNFSLGLRLNRREPEPKPNQR